LQYCTENNADSYRGVETLYASSKHSETHTIGMSLLAGFALMFL
jgi:hypothetical protein